MIREPPIITMSNLAVTVQDRRLFDAFALHVNPGEKIRISGASGCGKTTLFMMLMGFRQPETGSIIIDGTPLNRNTVHAIRRKMALVPQEPDPGNGTVREALAQPFRFRANAALKSNLDRVPELMDRFLLKGMDPDKPVLELSGGEKQRIAVIAAILLDRKIYLLDEATSALDAAAKRAVMSYFTERDHLTVLAISHDDALNGFTRTMDLDDPGRVG